MRVYLQITLAILVCLLSTPCRAADTPHLGATAPDFALSTLAGETISLKTLTSNGPTVLVVLRGWPGYQCPICDRQVNDFISEHAAFAQSKSSVVFVYPGPAENLKAHAAEFQSMKGRQWPGDFYLLLDPDFTFVNAYGLRWNAPKETAYPATFIIDPKGVIRFAQVSHSHGDRAKASVILKEIPTSHEPKAQ